MEVPIVEEAARDNLWSPLEYSQVAPKVQHLIGSDLLTRFPFGGSEKILDVGSGDGSFTLRHLLPRVPTGAIYGLDSSTRMVEFARQGTTAFLNVEFFHGDISRRDTWSPRLQQILSANGVDVVFSNLALHHLPSIETHFCALNNMVDSLCSGGTLLLSFSTRGNFSQLIDAAQTAMRKPKWHSVFYDFKYPLAPPDKSLYRSLLESTGVTITHLAEVDYPVVFEDQSCLSQFIKSCLVTIMSRLRSEPDHVQLEFAEDAAKEYNSYSSQSSDGKYSDRKSIVACRNVVAVASKY